MNTRRDRAAAWESEREQERQATESRRAADCAKYEAGRERERQERAQRIADRAAVISATPASEHLARAAQIYATPVSSDEQAPHLLRVMVELGFAIAKGQAR